MASVFNGVKRKTKEGKAMKTIKNTALGLWVLILILAMYLSACSDEPKPKYTTQFDDISINLVVNSYDSYRELREALESEDVDVLPGHKGYAYVKRVNGINRCTIYVVKWDFKTTGHELHHCMTGSFHK